MKKTLIYLFVLLLLGGCIYFFIIKDNSNPFTTEDSDFTIKDTADIGKIFIASNDGESVLIERTDSCWLLNKKYKALPGMTNLMMNTLYQQQTLYPVTKTAKENTIKFLTTYAIKVEVYNRKGIKKKIFYVGGEAANGAGTNMIMENSKTPYVVHIINFNGFLTARYSFTEKDWRDRTVFNLEPDEIKSISMQYFNDTKKSFILTREENKLIVKGDPEIVKKPEDLNEHNAKVYLNYFKNVNCEGFLNGSIGMDSLIRTGTKHSELDVTGMHGQHQHVQIYWMPINKRSKNQIVSDKEVPDDFDADRLFAIINNDKDTVMIQQFVFKKIFRKAAEFYTKGTTPIPIKY